MTRCNGFDPVMHACMDCFQVSGHSELYSEVELHGLHDGQVLHSFVFAPTSEVELHGLHDGQVDSCRQLMQVALN